MKDFEHVRMRVDAVCRLLYGEGGDDLLRVAAAEQARRQGSQRRRLR